MFFFPSKTKFSHPCLSIVIGTGSIGAMVYYPGDYARNIKPRIVKIIKLPHLITPTVDFARLEGYIKNEVKTLSKSILGEKVRIHEVHVVLSSPWYFSQTRLVEITRDASFLFTKHILTESIEEEKKLFMEYAAKRFALFEASYTLLEVSLMKVLLNGYEVHSFLNKHAREVVLAFYMSVSSKDFIEKFSNFLEMEFNPQNIVFHSTPFVFYSFLKQFWAYDKEKGHAVDEGVILIDIGGEVTDVTIIRKGIIEETFSFGKGVHFIIRRVAGALHMNPEDAKALISAWTRKEIVDTRHGRIEAIFKKALEEWAVLFQKTLEVASRNKFLPNLLVCTGEGADFIQFKEVLQGDRWKEYIAYAKFFEVKILSPSTLRDYLRYEENMFTREEETTALYAAALPFELVQY